MAFTATFAPTAATIGGTTLTGIQSQGGNLGTEVLDEADSGELTPREIYVNAQKPNARFSTLEVQAALVAVLTAGVGGKNLESANLTMYAKKRERGGSFASSGHDSRKMDYGIIVPGTLRCDHQQNAVLDLQAQITANPASPTTDPITYGSTSPPAGSGTVNRFTLGAITAGGVTIPQITRVEVQLGIAVETEGSDSEIWPLEATIREWKPIIRVTTTNAIISGLRSSLGAAGSVSIAFRKRVTGASLTTGFSLTSTGSIAYPDSFFEAGARASQESTFECRPYWDGSTDPIVLA